MTKETTTDFASELKNKHQAGLLKPSDFKNNRRWSLPMTNQQPASLENPDLAKLQTELRTVKANLTTLKAELTESNQEKEALELALFDKRLENLKQFSHYQGKLKNLEATELTALANLRKEHELLKKRLEKNEFNHKFSLDANSFLLFFILTTFIFLLTK